MNFRTLLLIWRVESNCVYFSYIGILFEIAFCVIRNPNTMKCQRGRCVRKSNNYEHFVVSKQFLALLFFFPSYLMLYTITKKTNFIKFRYLEIASKKFYFWSKFINHQFLWAIWQNLMIQEIKLLIKKNLKDAKGN